MSEKIVIMATFEYTIKNLSKHLDNVLNKKLKIIDAL